MDKLVWGRKIAPWKGRRVGSLARGNRVVFLELLEDLV